MKGKLALPPTLTVGVSALAGWSNVQPGNVEVAYRPGLFRRDDIQGRQTSGFCNGGGNWGELEQRRPIASSGSSVVDVCFKKHAGRKPTARLGGSARAEAWQARVALSGRAASRWSGRGSAREALRKRACARCLN